MFAKHTMALYCAYFLNIFYKPLRLLTASTKLLRPFLFRECNNFSHSSTARMCCFTLSLSLTFHKVVYQTGHHIFFIILPSAHHIRAIPHTSTRLGNIKYFFSYSVNCTTIRDLHFFSFHIYSPLGATFLVSP